MLASSIRQPQLAHWQAQARSLDLQHNATQNKVTLACRDVHRSSGHVNAGSAGLQAACLTTVQLLLQLLLTRQLQSATNEASVQSTPCRQQQLACCRAPASLAPLALQTSALEPAY